MKLEDLPTNEVWESYDWKQTFPSADDDEYGNSGDYSGTYLAGDLTGQRTEDVTAERIVEVAQWYAYSPEDGGGSRDFWALVKLTDGQYAVSEAWADYTGWGCQADAWWKVGTYEACVAELSEVNRKALTS